MRLKLLGAGKMTSKPKSRRGISVPELFRIAKAADKLENFIGKNSGHTADFPMSIVCDNDETSQMAADLLTELNDALKVFRSECKAGVDR